MKEKLAVLKEFVGKLSSKTKKLIIAGAVVLVIGAVCIAFVLNNKPYAVLFYELGAEEAQQIVEKLQEDGTEFKYQGDTTIMVKEEELDQVKAKLVQEGYPKSGFTYDTYTENASMMTTDSDKQLYKLYELQDRIGATICLFDGVKDAKVTIALGEESKYALSDEAEQKSTATAVITMKDGGSPSEKQAAAVQRLVAKSVPKMQLEDVAIFDGNMNDVSTTESGANNGSDAEEIAKVVEEQIAKKVMKVLGPIYGNKNVHVSARAQINMEQLIREVTTYNTPEKIDQNDKTGIVGKEELYNEESTNNVGAGGVAGTETNADTPEYNTNGNNNGSRANSESVSREYLVDQIKEQGQISPGALEDLTVSVAINQNGLGDLTEAEVKELVGNASGIAAEDRADKIAIASVPFYEEEEVEETSKTSTKLDQSTLIALIAGLAVLLILLLIVFIILWRRHKKKALEEEMEEDWLRDQALENAREEQRNREILEMQNDKGLELKRNIRDFADKNPEISAQLLRSWLNGGGQDGE